MVAAAFEYRKRLSDLSRPSASARSTRYLFTRARRCGRDRGSNAANCAGYACDSITNAATWW